MKTLKFHGCGDDTFGEYEETGQDCDNCGNEKPISCVVDCGERGRVRVVGQYGNVGDGCWLIGLTKVSEYDEWPDWNFRYEQSDCEYSPALLMDLPEGSFDLKWFIGKERIVQ